MAVLVISLNSDVHADAVVDQLRRSGIQVFRIDPTDDSSLPSLISFRSHIRPNAIFEFQDGDKLEFSSLTGILCRFAIETLIPSEGVAPLVHFSEEERIAAFLAPLRMVRQSFWINDPWVESRADCRILQSSIAADLDLNVPRFIVSTSYSDLVQFYAENPDCVIKPIGHTPLAKVGEEFVAPERLDTEFFTAPYATHFSPLSCGAEAGVDDTPTLIQVRIPKVADIRATVIDNQVFAASMPVQYNSPIDFRQQPVLDVEYFDLPNNITRSLVKLVGVLGLRFASCDLVLDESGRFYFLEANVSGNWLWTERFGLPSISAALAAALVQRSSPVYA